MRKIKFRGRIHDGWKFVYGFYYEENGNSFICNAEHELKLSWLVAPESVAQFVGYDRNGKEVYEGDICLDNLENEHKISISFPRRYLGELILKEED